MDFSFPNLSPPDAAAASSSPSTKKLPLTAYSTVTHVQSKHEPALLSESQNDDNIKRGRLPESSSSHLDWMKLNLNDSSQAPDNPSCIEATRWVSNEELRVHRNPTDAWVSIRGQVYDVTSYLQFHPGGAKILLSSCGRDSTDLFDKYHRWIDASYLLGSKRVGQLQADKE